MLFRSRVESLLDLANAAVPNISEAQFKTITQQQVQADPRGAGFIGSNFTRYWVEEHPDDRVVVLDLLTYAGNQLNLVDVEARISFAEGDIGDLDLVEQLLREHSIDIVVNFAAESHNSLAIIDPGRFFRTNVLGTQTLLEGSRRVGLQRFHHISTCEVYGDLPLDSDEVFTEESP